MDKIDTQPGFVKRPDILSIDKDAAKSDEEIFQNTVLRTIIKMNHELIMAHFETYLTSKKISLLSLSEDKRRDFIVRSFRQDLTLRNEYRGIVMGHFTLVEYKNYVSMKTGLNKRIANIIMERVLSQLHLFIK